MMSSECKHVVYTTGFLEAFFYILSDFLNFFLSPSCNTIYNKIVSWPRVVDSKEARRK